MQISQTQVDVWQQLEKSSRALSASELTGASPRAVRNFLKQWVEAGIVFKAPTFPPVYCINPDKAAKHPTVKTIKEAAVWFGADARGAKRKQ